MAFPLTREQQDFQRAVREFAERVVGPAAVGRVPGVPPATEVLRATADLGLFGLPFSSTDGGLDGDLGSFCLCVEELARADIALADLLVHATPEAANAVARAGSDAQRARWLRPMARGRLLGTVVPAGSVRARPSEDGLALEGELEVVRRTGDPRSALRVVSAALEGLGPTLLLLPVEDLERPVPPDRVLGGPGEAGSILDALAPDVWLARAASAAGSAGPKGGAAAERVRDAYLAACRLRDRGLPYRDEAAEAIDRARDLRFRAGRQD